MRSSSKILIIFIFLALLIAPLNIYAKSNETFGDKLDELDSLKKQKEDKENEKRLTEAEYKKISNEIVAIENEIANLSTEIQEATKEIAQLEKNIELKKEETNNILVFLQLSSGEKEYLEYVFKAKSFTDFIHRVSVVEQLSKYNKEQIAEMNEMIKKNNELKKKNEERIKKQEVKKEESRKKVKELGSEIDRMETDSLGIDDQIKSLEEEIQRLRQDGCEKRSDKISQCAKMYTATGFLRPLEQGRVTSEYSWRIHPVTGLPDSHSGIDLGGNSEGTPVYPVANGQVLYKVYRASCGGNMIYVKHIINGKNYTSVYMHLLSFGEYKPGDNVRYDDVIGYVGGGSTSKSNGGYDGCTTGAHLHLTLATGHTTNHRATMFNPREVIVFPEKRVLFNTRYF